MNRAEELCHSSGPWKKHKYFKKIGEGANAVYKYARDKVSDAAYEAENAIDDAKWNAKQAAKDVKNKITGEGYKEGAKSWEEAAKSEDERAKNLKKEIYEPAHEEGDEEWKRLSKNAMKGARENALEYRKTAADLRERYRTDSLKGRSEEAIKKVKKALTPQETVTITDTKTGKTRTPSKPKSQSDTVNIKKKRLKHDDLGVAYISHAETQSSIERGQEKINQLFGKWYN